MPCGIVAWDQARTPCPNRDRQSGDLEIDLISTENALYQGSRVPKYIHNLYLKLFFQLRGSNEVFAEHRLIVAACHVEMF